MALRSGGTSMSWLAESLADWDDQTSDGWCWLRQNAAAERSFSSTCHHMYKWNIRHTSTLLMECADQMELFSVASRIYLFIRGGNCVKKMTKVSTICCHSCTFASKLQLFCHKTHLHVKKNSKSLQHLLYFSKGIQTDSKLLLNLNTNRTCGPFATIYAAISMCRLD